jgi:hypothetical protein
MGIDLRVVSQNLGAVALSTAVTAGAAALFTTLPPVAGAVFGATHTLISRGLYAKIAHHGGDASDRLVAVCLGLIAATFIVASIGYPMTFAAAVYLWLGSCLVDCLIEAIVAGVFSPVPEYTHY